MNLQRIKSQMSPLVFYSREVALKGDRTNRVWLQAGLCPFHADRVAGSFFINQETGAFKCFSCGAKGGDVIAFVQMRKKLTFREALGFIAREWGIS